MRITLACFAGLIMASGCGQKEAVPGPEDTVFGGDRTVYLQVPSNYDHATPTPLLISLHGYGGSAWVQDRWTGLDKLVEERGILYLAPDGLTDPDSNRFWNAFPSCCDFHGSGVNDVEYLTTLVNDVSAVWNVDAKRIYFVGHSNGGWMSYRMACERPDIVAAIAPFSGAMHADPMLCNPSEPVSALHIHGAEDPNVPYSGADQQLGAVASLEAWAGYDDCASTRIPGTPERIDIESTADGLETVVETFSGCPDGIGLELWTMENVGHTPSWNESFHTRLYDWLAAHGKR